MATPGSIVVRNGEGQSANINTAFANRIQVQAYDTGGSPMTGVALVYSVPQTGASGTFASTGSGAFTVTTGLVGYADSDIITANGVAGNWTGLVQFVSAPGISAPWRLTNTSSVQTPYALDIVSGGTQKVQINTAYAQIQAKVTDNTGAPISGVSITFEGRSAYGSFPGGQQLFTAFTNASGIATSAVWTANSALGNFPVDITPQNLVALQKQASFTNVNATNPYTTQAISGSGQSTPVSTSFGAALVGRVLNELGGPVAGATLRFIGPSSGAYCTFYQSNWWADIPTDANGYATSNVPVANGVAGTYIVDCYTIAPTFTSFNAQFTLTNGAAPAVAVQRAPFFSDDF